MYSSPEFSGEAGAILGNPALRGPAIPVELTDLHRKLSSFYKVQFGVKLHHRSSFAVMTAGIPTEILLCLGLINPGDKVAICDPSHPVFPKAAGLSSASITSIPVSERTDYLPLPELQEAVTGEKIKLRFLNYPHNPSGAAADSNFFDRQVKAASKSDYLLCNRLGFCGVSKGENPHPSILQSPGARKVAVELMSFDLGFGLPEGMLEIAIGSPDTIAILKEMNSLVYELFPLYILKLFEVVLGHYADAAGEAAEKIKTNAEILSEGLRKLGWRTSVFKGAPFLWATHPYRKSSLSLSRVMLQRTGVVIVPGIRFGENGEGFVRFSLTATEAEIANALNRISKSLHPIKTGKAIFNKRIREIKNGSAND